MAAFTTALVHLHQLLECPQCKHLYRQAFTVVECGHNFCKDCLYDDLGETGQCPLCRLPARIGNIKRNPSYDTLVECLKALYALGDCRQPSQLAAVDYTRLEQLIQQEATTHPPVLPTDQQTMSSAALAPTMSLAAAAFAHRFPAGSYAEVHPVQPRDDLQAVNASHRSSQSDDSMLAQLSAAAAFLANHPTSTPQTHCSVPGPIKAASQPLSPPTSPPHSSPRALHHSPTTPSNDSRASDHFVVCSSPHPHPAMLHYPIVYPDPLDDGVDLESNISSLPDLGQLFDDDAPAFSPLASGLGRAIPTFDDSSLPTEFQRTMAHRHERTYGRAGKYTSEKRRSRTSPGCTNSHTKRKPSPGEDDGQDQSDGEQHGTSQVKKPTKRSKTSKPSGSSKAHRATTNAHSDTEFSAGEPSLPCRSSTVSAAKATDTLITAQPVGQSPPSVYEARLIITSLSGAKLTKLERCLQRALFQPGFFKVTVVDDFPKPVSLSKQPATGSPAITHVVTCTDSQGHCPRTLKYMHGILAGCTVIDYRWVLRCVASGKYVDEAPYQVTGDSMYSRLVRERQVPELPLPLGFQRAQASLARQEPRLFAGLSFYLDPNSFGDTASVPTGYDIRRLVKQGGAKVVSTLPALFERIARSSDGDSGGVSLDLEMPIIIAKPEQLAQALVTNEPSTSPPAHSARRRSGASSSNREDTVASRQTRPLTWLFNCVSAYQLLL
ncbi:BRCA1-associated RING domain protein 1 [Dimargaris verticillata]|uniref:BRCA1-associated RING domain protein 1 n=1 Tax=Dimargaris verticillata TaxID=2761393 RepID=A0A9W8B6B6_9FUNG|nr:BRCA1-associated RING domain protein 1 [Dimargaris verticillata]